MGSDGGLLVGKGVICTVYVEREDALPNGDNKVRPGLGRGVQQRQGSKGGSRTLV